MEHLAEGILNRALIKLNSFKPFGFMDNSQKKYKCKFRNVDTELSLFQIQVLVFLLAISLLNYNNKNYYSIYSFCPNTFDAKIVEILNKNGDNWDKISEEINELLEKQDFLENAVIVMKADGSMYAVNSKESLDDFVNFVENKEKIYRLKEFKIKVRKVDVKKELGLS